jgi:hypothetical protein
LFGSKHFDYFLHITASLTGRPKINFLPDAFPAPVEVMVMPDFERVFDDLSLHLAKTPEDRVRAEGFISGKNSARKEIVILFLFGAITGFIAASILANFGA